MKNSYLFLSFILFFIGVGLRAQTLDANLIDITTLEQLDAMRYDLDGNGQVADDPLTTGINEATVYSAAFGTPSCVAASACTGYELTANLDFNDADGAASGTLLSRWAETATTVAAALVSGTPVSGGWVPIGDNSTNSTATRFTATFDGNGRTISNLYINTSTLDRRSGLFGYVENGAIRNLGLEGGSVNSTGDDARVGGLVGQTRGVTISACYVTKRHGRNSCLCRRPRGTNPWSHNKCLLCDETSREELVLM